MVPSFALALLLAADPQPPPQVKLPIEFVAAPGRLATLTAESTGSVVRWALASDDADLIPFPDGKSAVFCAAKPGRYLVLAWTAAGDVPSQAARCTVVVGDPPGPPPGPGPTPPPADQLTDDLKKLFDADATADKAAHAAQLAALYREAVAFADRTDVRTASDLAERIKAAASSLLPATALVQVRKRIAEEVARTLPTDADKPLEAPTRKAAAKLFDRIAHSLEGLK